MNEVCSIALLSSAEVTAHYSNPPGEANKTIAYETCIQLGKCAPDHVFAPIGGAFCWLECGRALLSFVTTR